MALRLGARSAWCLHAKLEKHAHAEWMRPVITQLGEQTILCVNKNMVLSAGNATHLPGTRFIPITGPLLAQSTPCRTTEDTAQGLAVVPLGASSQLGPRLRVWVTLACPWPWQPPRTLLLKAGWEDQQREQHMGAW